MSVTTIPARSCAPVSRGARSARRSSGAPTRRLPQALPPAPAPVTTSSTRTQGRRPAMTDQELLSRRERRALERESVHGPAAERRKVRIAQRARESRNARLRKLAFGGIVVAVLAIGGALAFGDFFVR